MTDVPEQKRHYQGFQGRRNGIQCQKTGLNAGSVIHLSKPVAKPARELAGITPIMVWNARQMLHKNHQTPAGQCGPVWRISTNGLGE
ncbi:MAG: hypothetical protein CMG77_04945 [Marinimicrobium sp.]|nr:hypothetical protein [Marinimicrobium sp.]